MFHVIIVGNGLTGGALALALAQQGLQVLVVDQKDPNQPLVPDGRSFALSFSASTLFSTLGIWQELEEITPITFVHTSDGVRPNWVDYEAHEITRDALGYVVDSSLLRAKILEKVLNHKSITLHAPTSLKRFEQTLSHVRVETDQGTILEAPLCVASDGKFSTLRNWAQIPCWEWSYDQTAIVCTMGHTLPHYNQAFEHFLPSGPLAFIPRSGNTSGLVWSIETKKAPALLSLSNDEFAKEVFAQFGPSLGTFTVENERWSYPLSVCLPKRFVSKRLALLGDAAHSFHPVTGQGLNVGLRDVTTLADIIHKAFSLGLDIGSSYVLEQYQKRRRLDVLSMTFLTDGLTRVFSTKSRPMAHLRSLGFGLVKNCTPLRHFMIRYAAGVA